jgi:hypothetical protein
MISRIRLARAIETTAPGIPRPFALSITRPATDAGFADPRGLLVPVPAVSLPAAELALPAAVNDPRLEPPSQDRQAISAAMTRMTAPTATTTRFRTGPS